MIELPRHTAAPAAVRIKILGLGGAGANALDRIKLDGLEGAELIAINTDVQSLTSSVADQKVQLGASTTRGLGAGGDPEVGFAAAEEAIDEIREALQGATLVFLCVGLGGGTGSGAARIITSIARELQAVVVVFATMPFSLRASAGRDRPRKRSRRCRRMPTR
jgi:cell division protein FtsZ